MKQIFCKKRLLSIFMFFSSFGFVYSQVPSFNIIIDKTINGTLKLDPELPVDGKYPAGTVITVTTTPAAGYVLDSGYFLGNEKFGKTQIPILTEFMTSTFKMVIDKDKHIGASFIEKSAVAHINVTHNILYAKPGVKPLKYDVFSPKGAKNLPCIIIIHGGGWKSNNEDVMRGLARELTKGGKYVVFSIDYRWVQKFDGDTSNNTMADLMGDVFGAIAHIMEHAAKYGGDPSRIGLTGDSAGGHLSAACANMPNKIGRGGFGKTMGVFEFMPSYIPKNKTVEQIRIEQSAAIKAVAPSYGVFGGSMLHDYSDSPTADNTWRDAISPINNIPYAKDRVVPHFLIRGTDDILIMDEGVKAYVDALVKAGQSVEYVQVGGANHAFFDWKPDASTKAIFAKYGVYYAAEMKAFFNSVFYK